MNIFLQRLEMDLHAASNESSDDWDSNTPVLSSLSSISDPRTKRRKVAHPEVLVESEPESELDYEDDSSRSFNLDISGANIYPEYSMDSRQSSPLNTGTTLSLV